MSTLVVDMPKAFGFCPSQNLPILFNDKFMSSSRGLAVHPDEIYTRCQTTDVERGDGSGTLVLQYNPTHSVNHRDVGRLAGTQRDCPRCRVGVNDQSRTTLVGMVN